MTRPPVTQPPVTQPPAPNPIPQDRVELVAMAKMLGDHHLTKVRLLKWNDPVLFARAYYPKSGFLYVAADATAAVDSSGNYKITNVRWIVSFSPLS